MGGAGRGGGELGRGRLRWRLGGQHRGTQFLSSQANSQLHGAGLGHRLPDTPLATANSRAHHRKATDQPVRGYLIYSCCMNSVYSRIYSCCVNSLPGFRMPFGSNICLMDFIHGRVSSCSCARYGIFPIPTPCSPVQVPPRSSAYWTIL